MAFRNEWKYLVNRQQKAVIEKRLSLLCQPDSHALQDGGYTVSSLYFDDFQNSNFAIKIAGYQKKKKFRIRIYNDRDDVIKLERKIKKGWAVKKDSVLISQSEYENILTGRIGHDFSADCPVKNDFFRLQRMRRLSPKIVVSFDRTVFTYAYGNVRLCFDSALRTPQTGNDLFNQGLNLVVMEPYQAIFEVKYTGFLPETIKTAIQSGLGNKERYSKYATCMYVSRKGVHYDV
jgi:hypothetical protein